LANSASQEFDEATDAPYSQRHLMGQNRIYHWRTLAIPRNAAISLNFSTTHGQKAARWQEQMIIPPTLTSKATYADSRRTASKCCFSPRLQVKTFFFALAELGTRMKGSCSSLYVCLFVLPRWTKNTRQGTTTNKQKIDNENSNTLFARKHCSRRGGLQVLALQELERPNSCFLFLRLLSACVSLPLCSVSLSLSLSLSIYLCVCVCLGLE